MNELPKGWYLKKLGELCSVTYGKGLPVKNFKPSGYPVFGANGVIGFYDKYLFDEPRVLISCRGAASGKINLSPAKCFVTNNSLVLDILVKEDLEKKFLFYALTVATKTELVTGTAQPQVTINNAIDLDISIPALLEQKRIVTKIEELFSKLDKGIENLMTVQEQLIIYRQAVLKWAFEGKLTNEYILKEELPKGWCLKRFDHFFLGKPQNGLYKNVSEYGSGIKIIRIDGFYDGTILSDYNYKKVNISKDEIKKYCVSNGDILINRVNSVSHLGKCGIVKNISEDFVFESNIMKIKINKRLALPEYLSMYLSSLKGLKELRKNAKQAVNQASINQTDVSNVIIPIPELISEQLQIVAEIESRLSVCDKLEESINQSLQQAEALRQSILKKAFEGKLVPQDPNDEPASVLLERIQAERATVVAKNATTRTRGKPARKQS